MSTRGTGKGEGAHSPRIRSPSSGRCRGCGRSPWRTAPHPFPWRRGWASRWRRGSRSWLWVRGAAAGRARQAPPADSAPPAAALRHRPRPRHGPMARRGPSTAPARANGSRRSALGPAQLPLIPLAPPPPSRGRKANAIAPPQNGGRGAPACGTDPAAAPAERNGAATTPAGGPRAGRAHSRSGAPRAAHGPPRFPRAPLCGKAPGAITNLGCGSRCRPSRTAARGGSGRRLGRRVLPRRQTAPNAAQHRRCAAKWRRPRASAPPRAAIGGDAATPLPRESRAGRGRGRSPGGHVGAAARSKQGELCWGVKHKHRCSFAHPLHTTGWELCHSCVRARARVRRFWVRMSKYNMRGGKYVKSSWSA